jgi:pimeloyl-ACP methyl ester carboxylesterase
MNGDFESKSVLKHTKKMMKVLKSAFYVQIPDAGHASNMENPEAFNKAIEKFLVQEVL